VYEDAELSVAADGQPASRSCNCLHGPPQNSTLELIMASEYAEPHSADLDSIAKAFGLVVINWGNAEQSLDMLIALLWQSFPTRAYSRKIPMMLAPKLEFGRKAFAAVDALRPFQQEAESVFAEFDRLSNLRHDLIHGAVASLAPVDGHFVLNRFDIHDGFHHVREVRIPVAAYPHLVRDLVNLGGNAYKVAAKVFDLAKTLDEKVEDEL